MTATSLTHHRQNRPRYVKSAKDIRCELPLDISDVILFKEAELAVSRIVDQNTDRVKTGDSGINNIESLSRIGGVQRRR